jgi:hypothetical protein
MQQCTEGFRWRARQSATDSPSQSHHPIPSPPSSTTISFIPPTIKSCMHFVLRNAHSPYIIISLLIKWHVFSTCESSSEISVDHSSRTTSGLVGERKETIPETNSQDNSRHCQLHITRWTIDLGVDCLLADHVREMLFRSLRRQLKQVQSLERDSPFHHLPVVMSPSVQTECGYNF